MSEGGAEIAGVAERLFRQESGKLVSVLTGIFGIERLQFAEDVVQEALVRALRSWPENGVPKNPAAWLTQTAKNLALDLIRREQWFQERQPQIIASVERWGQGASEEAAFETEIKDERLRLIFACCHPQIPAESQIALALKTLCGFTPAEIAKAFLTTEAAIAKRLTRARQRIQELRIRFEIPSGEEIPERLDGVLQTLYLLFNEGYKASSGGELIREELCREAIRLACLVAEHPVGNRPRVHALAALMLLNASRLPARADAAGNLLRLEEQDRTKWDRTAIARGLFHLAESAAGTEASEYHLQAGIAALHCIAPSYAATDWKRILYLYDALAALDDSPVVALNRAVAVAQVHGPEAGSRAVEKIRDRAALANYHLLHAVLAEFEFQRGNRPAAIEHGRKALELAEQASERAHLARRLEVFSQGAERKA